MMSPKQIDIELTDNELIYNNDSNNELIDSDESDNELTDN